MSKDERDRDFQPSVTARLSNMATMAGFLLEKTNDLLDDLRREEATVGRSEFGVCDICGIVLGGRSLQEPRHLVPPRLQNSLLCQACYELIYYKWPKDGLTSNALKGLVARARNQTNKEVE